VCARARAGHTWLQCELIYSYYCLGPRFSYYL